VRFIVQRDPGIASLPRRVGAGAIDVVVIGGGMLGAGIAIAVLGERRRDGEPLGWMGRLQQSDIWSRPTFAAAVSSLELTARNWRTPGMRIAGIRLADANTLGPVSLGSASAKLLVRMESERIVRALGQPARARAESRRLAANDEIERMRASRPDGDPAELMRDAVEVRRRLGASTCTWMLPRVLVHEAIERLPALWSSRRQTLTQRLAGTVVIDDP